MTKSWHKNLLKRRGFSVKLRFGFSFSGVVKNVICFEKVCSCWTQNDTDRQQECSHFNAAVSFYTLKKQNTTLAFCFKNNDDKNNKNKMIYQNYACFKSLHVKLGHSCLWKLLLTIMCKQKEISLWFAAKQGSSWYMVRKVCLLLAIRCCVITIFTTLWLANNL